jgi:copper(I)-binding protein
MSDDFDDFEERLRRRLGRLDAAVPPGPEVEPPNRSARRSRVRLSTGLPLGAAAGLACIVIVLAVAGAGLQAGRPGPTPVVTVASGSVVSPGASTSVAPGMIVGNAQALPVPGSGNPVIVVATITNATGRDVKLVGASSPVATRAGLYATGGCACTASPGGSGGAGLFDQPMPWWLVRPGETIRLRSGSGKVILEGLARPLGAGETVRVTFLFDSSASVTVEIPVVAQLAEG